MKFEGLDEEAQCDVCGSLNVIAVDKYGKTSGDDRAALFIIEESDVNEDNALGDEFWICRKCYDENGLKGWPEGA